MSDLNEYDQEIDVTPIPPDYFIVEYEIEVVSQRWDSKEARLVSESKVQTGAFHHVFTNREEAESYATSDTATSVWESFSAITFIGNHVVPLARIPF